MNIRHRLKIVAAVLFIIAGVCVLVFAKAHAAANGKMETTLATGKELFKANCARCHGENGEGGKGPNLTTEKKKAKWNDSDEKLISKIKKGGLFMPSFKSKLKETDIAAIAAYVRQLPTVSD